MIRAEGYLRHAEHSGSSAAGAERSYADTDKQRSQWTRDEVWYHVVCVLGGTRPMRTDGDCVRSCSLRLWRTVNDGM